jgi:large subunit ribosomal protein L10
MALTKDQKNTIVSDTAKLLSEAKMTVVASYPGTTVSSIQTLRKQARENGTTIRVIKNRLVIKALSQTENLKDIPTTAITGQLLYAFNNEDEVAPAQVIANFAKTSPTLEFIGAFTAEGQFLGTDDVKALASLPTKDQLRGQLVGTIAAPLSGFVNVLAGNVRGVLNVLTARSKQLEA